MIGENGAFDSGKNRIKDNIPQRFCGVFRRMN